MKKLFLIILCFMLTPMLFSQQLFWKEDKKLTWDDFQSPVNRKNNPDVVAYTHCGWEYTVVKSTNPKSPVKIEIQTIFNIDKSWKDVKRINDYVLNHEQKHFDIAEVFSRKLRKEVAEKIKTSGDYDRNFKGIYSRIMSEYRNFQMSYDKETNHGNDKEKQAEYNARISQDLENFKSYKNS